MKKPIETKRIFVTALILFMAFFISPLSSFGEGAFVYRHVGDIEGLVFDFGEHGLPLELPGLGEVIVKCAEVQAPGREIIVISPAGQYNYYTKLQAGIIYAIDPTTFDQSGYSTCLELYHAEYDYIVRNNSIELFFGSAMLSEHFTIEPPIPDNPEEFEVPQDVDLFFKVKHATLYGMSFDLMLKLKHSELQFIMFKP
jgi:hypothetical protein